MLPRTCLRGKLLKYCLVGIFSVFLLDYFGIYKHMFELDYYRLFYYPMEGDVLRYAHQVRFNQEIEVQPINVYNYRYLKDAGTKCMDEGHPVTPKLVLLVKSAMKNFNRREAIRKCWGYERRFSDIIIRTVFLLGINENAELQKHINIESDQYKDIVQADYIDTYYNNTIKTMIGFQWVVKFCQRGQFFMFVDDDFYVSTKNVLRFLRHPSKYPEYLEEADEALRKLARRLNQSDLKNNSNNAELYKEANKILAQGINSLQNKNHFHNIEEFAIKGPENYEKIIKSINNDKIKNNRKKRDLMDMELPENAKLFSGSVFISSPHRHKSSKWYVSLAEYPFHLWPPYVTAGSYILSREALFEIYFTSLYTRHFRFDDIFLGIVALKAKITPLHNEEFYFHKATYSGPYSYRYVIASHGYDNPDELSKIWSETRAAGHA